MGRGGCMLNFVDMGIQTIRSLIGCLCCLLVVGPLFILIGVVMIVAPNNRAENVAKYNSAVENYTSDGSKAAMQGSWALLRATSGYTSQNMTPITRTVTVSGNTDDVTPNVNSVVLETTSNPYLGYTRTVEVHDASGLTNTFSVGPVSSPTHDTYVMSCDRGSSSSSTSHSSTSDYCSLSYMESKCRTKAGCTEAYYSGTGCYRYQSCGTCGVYRQVTKLCYQMIHTSSGWARDYTYESCDYPFTSQKRECSSSSSYSSYVPVTLRSSDDPYIALSRITKGDMNFGLTAAQQRGIGMALVLVGAAFTAGVVALCVCMKNACTNHEHKAAVYQAFGRTYQYPQGYQPQLQQPINAQAYPQPGFPPQQPGYAQPQPMMPQPGYGQPQPGYGQPQPGYGQPQPGYGQPGPKLV